MINPDTLTLLDAVRLLAGAAWRDMTPSEEMGFQGAEDGSLVADIDGALLMANPAGGEFDERPFSIIGNDADWQIDICGERNGADLLWLQRVI